MVWGKRKGSNAKKYGEMGFTCGLHLHHDHGDNNGKNSARFNEMIICAACNSLDAILKKEIHTHSNFSFSPNEMKMILKKAEPNEKIKRCDIDFKTASIIYEKHKKNV